MPDTAKKFVNAAFEFFDKLSDDNIEHRSCNYPLWKSLNYQCISWKKYTVTYLQFKNEIVICEFRLQNFCIGNYKKQSRHYCQLRNH